MRLRHALLAATALVAASFCAPAPARAEPISTAIGLTSVLAGAGLGAAAGSIGGTLIGLAASLGLSFLSQALAPKPKAGEAVTGIETSIQIGGDVARQIPVGRCSLKGQPAYVNTFGYENAHLQQVFILGDWSTEGLVELWLGGKRYVPHATESGPGWTTYQITEFGDLVRFRYYDGTQTAADGELMANANPPGRWTANSKLTGLSYVVCLYRYDKYAALYGDGIPQWSFVVDGAKLYDRRRDDTAGGAGPQRWHDPSSWAFSANPAVIRENYLRGFWRSGQLILGMGVPAYDLVGDSFVAAANAADESVTLDGGGTEPRYRCNTILSADEGVTHQQVLDVIGSTDAGYLYEAAGLYVCQAGVAQGVVRTVTDDDLLVDEPVTYAAKRSRSELVNRIHGQFVDPASGWQPQSYTPRISLNDTAIDGEELGRPLDLMSVSSQSQAERIAEIRRREARAQATGSIALGFQHRDLLPGDWIAWTSKRFTGVAPTTRVFRIAEREVRRANGSTRLSLEETGASVYAWGTADEGPPVALAIRAGDILLGDTVAQFSIAPVQILGADGLTEHPAIAATWTPITDPTVDEVVLQYRPIGTTHAASITDPTPGDGGIIIPGPLMAGTAYEVRATIRTTPLRPIRWTSWSAVTAGNSRFQIGLDDLLAPVRALLSDDPTVRGSIGEANAKAAEAFDHAEAAFENAAALWRDAEAAFSPNPSVRAISSSAAKIVQDTIDNLAGAVAGLLERFETHRGNVYEAGLGPLGNGGYGFAGIAHVDQRVNEVSVILDALKGTVTLLASSIQGVDGAALIGSITTIQQRLDAISGTLTSTASQAQVDELQTQFSQAQITLSSLGSIVQTTIVASQATEVEWLAEGLAALMGHVAARHERLLETVAYTSQTTSSRIDETGAAVAETAKRLLAVQGATAAEFTRIERVMADGDAANVSAIQALQAFNADPNSGNAALLARAITQEQVQASAAAAAASRLLALEVMVNGAGGVAAAFARLIALEQTEATNTTAAVGRLVALEGTVNGPDGVAGTRARLAIEEQVRNSQIEAHAGYLAYLEATLSGVNEREANTSGRLAAEEQTRATADAGIASRLVTMESGYGTLSGAVSATSATLTEFQQTSATQFGALSSSVSSLTTSHNDLAGFVQAVNSVMNTNDSIQAAAVQAARVLVDGITAEGRRSILASYGPDGQTLILEDRVSRTTGGGTVSGGRYLLMRPDGSVESVEDADRFYIGKMVNGQIVRARFLEFDTATGLVTIPSLRVTGETLAVVMKNKTFRPPLGQYASGNTNGVEIDVDIPGAVWAISFSGNMLVSLEFQTAWSSNTFTRLRADIIGPGGVPVIEPVFLGNGGTGTGPLNIQPIRFSAAANQTYFVRLLGRYSSVSAQGSASLRIASISYSAGYEDLS